ncbi:Hypothetical protein CAP_8892 [Chondromyces apiculatus DSM 436]|uniref:Uncharacterized protein n=1 Tax=Chondromyces apiculatus DSM 436 TaxID=1192034 RepID=A0A017SVE7_9BACT|nr:Hypothetical protein CAP_8892 [Chondromyces apiculatus DSM 436]
MLAGAQSEAHHIERDDGEQPSVYIGRREPTGDIQAKTCPDCRVPLSEACRASPRSRHHPHRTQWSGQVESPGRTHDGPDAGVRFAAVLREPPGRCQVPDALRPAPDAHH